MEQKTGSCTTPIRIRETVVVEIALQECKITWNADGTPDFGTPVAPGTELELPSGTSEIKNTENEN